MGKNFEKYAHTKFDIQINSQHKNTTLNFKKSTDADGKFHLGDFLKKKFVSFQLKLENRKRLDSYFINPYWENQY